MSPNKVAIIGANGTLGPHVLSALRASEFSVVVISRKSSKSTYTDDVEVRVVSDDPSSEEYVKAVSGCDVVVATLGGSNDTLQMKLADASVEAGVELFIPADFGSCDSTSERAISLVPLYGKKSNVRDHLKKLAETTKLTWTSIVPGHFFDEKPGSLDLLLFNVNDHTAKILDDGSRKWSTTTLGRVGDAVVRVLRNQDKCKNQMLYIQSFCISQNELLTSVEKATGKKWTVEHVNSEEHARGLKKKLEEKPGDSHATEELVGNLGITEADWRNKETFSNELLEFADEDLDEVVRRVLGKERKSAVKV
jgi:nucleoside-diphosphate-sugar epimerase